MSITVGFISLGCAKNLVNSEQMLWLLDNAGMKISGKITGVDAVVVNTCGFIESAKSEAIENILELAELKKEGQIKKIIVAGCLAERYKEEILEELPEIDAIVGVGSFGEIVSAVKDAIEDKKPCLFGDLNAAVEETDRVITTPGASAYIKIAEGCDNRCAYCVIPDLRGSFRSRPMENILAEARSLAAMGIKELIVVAQDTTRYGTDLYGERRLPALLKEMCKIEGLNWIRLHYLYPDEIDGGLIEVIAQEDKIVKYLDIPIQHINDGILKAMNRRSTGEDIRRLFTRLRREIPSLVLRTSLITGLPGEGEAEFEELCAFLREYKIERAGVFPYSPEEGTPAAQLPRPDDETAKRRAEMVMALQSKIMDEYNAGMLGVTLEVLCEGFDRFAECHYGRSFADSPDIDGKVFFTGKNAEAGAFVKVKITGILDGDLMGEGVD